MCSLDMSDNLWAFGRHLSLVCCFLLSYRSLKNWLCVLIFSIQT